MGLAPGLAATALRHGCLVCSSSHSAATWQAGGTRGAQCQVVANAMHAGTQSYVLADGNARSCGLAAPLQTYAINTATAARTCALRVWMMASFRRMRSSWSGDTLLSRNSSGDWPSSCL